MITKDQIEASLKEIIARRKASSIDEIPEGWVTVNAAAKIIGLSEPTMRSYLRESFKKGEINRKNFRIATGRRSPMPIPHYFLGKKLK